MAGDGSMERERFALALHVALGHEPEPLYTYGMSSVTTSRLSPSAALTMRGAIRLAGGREVCFVCAVDEEGLVQSARVVARGDAGCVLALPGFAKRGEMMVHNHPSGLLEPSHED